MTRRFCLFVASLLTSAALAQTVNFTITVDGFQENPPTGSTATGSGTATLDTATNLFSWNISFANLSSAQTNAHFHGNATACTNAGVQIGLPLGSPIVGSQTVTAAQAANILAGRYYLNIHTANFPGGEIRGNVMPAAITNPFPLPISAGPIHVQLETIATGLTAPNWGTFAPGDDTRIFVTDQNGTLWSIGVNPISPPTVFLNVAARLVPLGIGGPNTFDERGLLGVAFHPNYAANGKLYTYTSEPDSAEPDFTTMPTGTNPNHQTVIAEWLVPNPEDPASVADPASRRVILRIDQPQFNHNGGCLNFGPDGFLYISLGDGGGRDDRDDGVSLGAPLVGHGCGGNGQNIESILGKLLRIDVNGNNSANGQYGNPPTNPFVGGPGLDEIFAYGLRNPFRFSIDSGSGTIYLGDVGQNALEEVNIITAGGNYGWRVKEGSFFFVFNGNQPGYITDRTLDAPPGLIDPIAQYDRSEGISVIGGFVYRGQRIPQLAGTYVFGEFARTFSSDGRLFHLAANNEMREFPLVGQPALARSLLGFGVDSRGEIYVLGNTTGTPFGTTGTVARIRLRPGDVNGDGSVNLEDLARLLVVFGLCAGQPGFNAAADFDGNGCVDLTDLATLLAVFGS
jgi:glucose/arabinose dehydrogenase